MLEQPDVSGESDERAKDGQINDSDDAAGCPYDCMVIFECEGDDHVDRAAECHLPGGGGKGINGELRPARDN